MKTFDIIVFIIALLLLGVAGGFAAASASNMAKNQQIGRNPRVVRARSNMIWASVISFVGLFLVLVALVLFFVFGNRSDAGTQKLIIGVVVALTFILILTAGVFAILGASNFRASGAYTGVGSDSSAYNQAIIASVLLIGGLGILLLVWLLVFFLRKPQRLQRAAGYLPESVQRQFLSPQQQAEVANLQYQSAARKAQQDAAIYASAQQNANAIAAQQGGALNARQQSELNSRYRSAVSSQQQANSLAARYQSALAGQQTLAQQQQFGTPGVPQVAQQQFVPPVAQQQFVPSGVAPQQFETPVITAQPSPIPLAAPITTPEPSSILSAASFAAPVAPPTPIVAAPSPPATPAVLTTTDGYRKRSSYRRSTYLQ